jgi:hypothetical protein
MSSQVSWLWEPLWQHALKAFFISSVSVEIVMPHRFSISWQSPDSRKMSACTFGVTNCNAVAFAANETIIEKARIMEKKQRKQTIEYKSRQGVMPRGGFRVNGLFSLFFLHDASFLDNCFIGREGDSVTVCDSKCAGRHLPRVW